MEKSLNSKSFSIRSHFLFALPTLCLLTNPCAQTPNLRTLSDRANLNYGTAVGSMYFSGTQGYKDLLKTEYNMFVSENDMKFASTEPSQGRFSFTKADQVYAFAKENGIRMRGHTLVWHSQSGWVTSSNLPRAEMLKAMKTHIDSVVGHFRGKMVEWDVVNEAMESNGLRNSFWRTQIGDDFIDSAFVFAHRADPNALLFYNDFSAEGINAKSDRIYAMVKKMKEKGIPIHGVGLQCHFTNSVNKADISKNIKRLGDLGLRVAITELDIVDASGSTQPWKDIMQACLENANCTSFLTWGVYDANSWRATNGTCNCLVFDAQMKAKAIYTALIETLQKADPTISAARKAFSTSAPVVIAKTQDPSLQNLHPMRISKTGIHYSLPKSGWVGLQVFNMAGTAVFQSGPQRQAPGEYSIGFLPNKITKGLYYVQLQIDGKMETARFIVEANH